MQDVASFLKCVVAEGYLPKDVVCAPVGGLGVARPPAGVLVGWCCARLGSRGWTFAIT